MSPCEIDSSKNYGRKKRHHQANAGNDDSRMSLLSFRWWRQTRLNSIAVTLAALTALATRKLWSLWETVLGIISCLEWLHWGSKLTRSRISTPHRRSWKALLWIAGLKVLAITSWHY
jgi:hypothetical protein